MPRRKGFWATKQFDVVRKWNPLELPDWLNEKAYRSEILPRPAELPNWPDEEFYRREILPRLSTFTVKAIRLAVDVSQPYATLIKRVRGFRIRGIDQRFQGLLTRGDCSYVLLQGTVVQVVPAFTLTCARFASRETSVRLPSCPSEAGFNW